MKIGVAKREHWMHCHHVNETKENTMSNTIYRRTESNWVGSTGDPLRVSDDYWRRQARKIFSEHTTVEAVEIVKTGRKTDSDLLKRGDNRAPAGFFVIVASTGGSYGKSRRDYPPAA